MSHRAVIEVGPRVVRRLCCSPMVRGDPEDAAAALEAIDDGVALVGGHPVHVDALWRSVLRSALCAERSGVLVVHPSSWPAARVNTLAAVARETFGAANDVVVQPRSKFVLGGSAEGVVVEIDERLVVVTGADVVALPRRSGAGPLVEEVLAAIARSTGTVLIDGPDSVPGASELAAAIAESIRGDRPVVQIDEARLRQLSRGVPGEGADRLVASRRGPRPGGNHSAALAMAVGAVVVVGLVGWAATALGGQSGHKSGSQRRAIPSARPTSTLLTEGRVALTVPSDWMAQRVVTGPGSPRVQVGSPSDPEVALHVTQTPVPGETLAAAADRLKHAIDAEPPGVFVDFNPATVSAGRSALTYREVRPGHEVRWTVLLDGSLRISVGCQNRPGGEAAVREACEQAVRSVHAVG